MKQSAAYPSGFARRVMKLHLKHQAHSSKMSLIPAKAQRPKDIRNVLYGANPELQKLGKAWSTRGMNTCPTQVKAPYAWQHAGLQAVAEFLRREKASGRFTPILMEGL